MCTFNNLILRIHFDFDSRSLPLGNHLQASTLEISWLSTVKSYHILLIWLIFLIIQLSFSGLVCPFVGRGGKQLVDPGVDEKGQEDEGQDDVAQDLPVAPSGRHHDVDPVEGAAQQARGAVKVAVQAVQQPVVVLGLLFHIQSDGLEVAGFGRDSLGILPVLGLDDVFGRTIGRRPHLAVPAYCSRDSSCSIPYLYILRVVN